MSSVRGVLLQQYDEEAMAQQLSFRHLSVTQSWNNETQIRKQVHIEVCLGKI